MTKPDKPADGGAAAAATDAVFTPAPSLERKLDETMYVIVGHDVRGFPTPVALEMLEDGRAVREATAQDRAIAGV